MAYIAESGIDAPIAFIDTVQQLDKKKLPLQAALEAAQGRLQRISTKDVMERLQAVVGIENSPMEQQKIAIHRAISKVLLYDDRFEIAVDNSVCGGGEGS